MSYALFEPATNVMLKAFRPSIFLPIIMIIWGICMTTMGLTYNFSGIMAARFFLGLAEAGLFPGVNYYLSCWYTRKEFGIRAVGLSILPPFFKHRVSDILLPTGNFLFSRCAFR